MTLLVIVLGWLVELAAALSPGSTSGPIGALAYAHAMLVHRASPIADRAAVTLTLPDGTSRTERLTVRVWAGSGGHVVVETPSLVASFEPGGAAAAHPGDPTTAVAWPCADRVDSGEVAARLPALPLPQIALALDDPRVPLALTSYTPGIEWLGAVVEHARGGARVRLVGRTPTGRASIELVGGRVRTYAADLPTAEGIATLEVVFEPIEPGEQDGWRVDTRGRRLITSLSGLSALERPLRIGDRMPVVSMYAGAAEARTPADAAYTALVFVRDPWDAVWWVDGEDAAFDSARAGVDGVVEFRRELTRRSFRSPRVGAVSAVPRVETLVVVLLEAGAVSVERFASFHDRWRAADGQSADQVVWSPAQRLTLDRIAPRSPAAVVLLGRDRSIVAVAELPAKSGDVARSLGDALGWGDEP